MSPPIRDGSGSNIGSIRLGDGTEIAEVRTGAGDVLFEAGVPDSVLAQELIAWYRFEDGDARDYTNDLDATFADSTAFDGSINGATFQSTAGVTDFNTGANSGAFDFAGGDEITVPEFDLNQGTVMAWFEVDDLNNGNLFAIGVDEDNFLGFDSGSSEFFFRERQSSGTTTIATSETLTTGTYAHLVWSTDGSNLKAWFNGEPYGPVSGSENLLFDEFGSPYNSPATRFELDGRLDDVRVYNRQLTDSEVSNIYNATKP